MCLWLHLWSGVRGSGQRNQTWNPVWKSPGRLGLPGLWVIQGEFQST